MHHILLYHFHLNYFFLYKKYKKSKEYKTLISDDFADFISVYKYFSENKENNNIKKWIYLSQCLIFVIV